MATSMTRTMRLRVAGAGAGAGARPAGAGVRGLAAAAAPAPLKGKKTPLYARHVELKGNLVDFAVRHSTTPLNEVSKGPRDD